MLLAIDAETNGRDPDLGARPFFATICTDTMDQAYWEWPTDPLTRLVAIPPEDIQEIREWLDRADTIVAQHAKFDVTALYFAGLTDWPWAKTEDTLLSGHLLASNRPHNLTAMAMEYLGVNILPYEEALKQAVLRARGVARTKLKDWRIARQGLEEMPSAKSQAAGCDYWLPKAVAQALHYPEGKCTVINLKREPFDVRIDRQSKWGNPFIIGKDGTRAEVIAKYRRWIVTQPKLMAALPELEGKRLGCWCKPSICHGDVLAELLQKQAHPWHTVLRDYSNADSAVTVKLWQVHKQELERRGLWAIYQEQRKLLQVIWEMERVGVTAIQRNLETMQREYQGASQAAGQVCVGIARSYSIGSNGAKQPYDLELPKGGVNNSLRDFCFGKRWQECPQCGWTPKSKKEKKELGTACPKCTDTNLVERTFTGLALPPVRNPKAKTSAPSLDAKTAIPFYLETLPSNSKQLRFVESLLTKREYDTALSFMAAYQKFWTPLEGADGWQVLHPSTNITGSATLRFSCENPNAQQISKHKKANLRRCFGPAPGREWWSLDAKNIELRLPAYLSGEEELISLFERADEPPYYGSEHLLNFSTVYPDIWEEALNKVGTEKVGPYCKEEYKDTWYRWCKNGDFAVGYNAVERPGGTADRAFHRDGSHRRLKSRFAKKEHLNRQCIDFANKHGYIETVPDRTVDPLHGYPLMCARTEYNGKISPTIPLSYKIQGTACWVLRRGMVLVANYLQELSRDTGERYSLILNVHDELLLDFPYRAHKGNLPKVRKVRLLLESVGRDLVPAIPLPFGVEYHPRSWAEGEVVKC